MPSAGRRLEAVAGSGNAASPEANRAWLSARAEFDGLGLTRDLDVVGRNLGLFW